MPHAVRGEYDQSDPDQNEADEPAGRHGLVPHQYAGHELQHWCDVLQRAELEEVRDQSIERVDLQLEYIVDGSGLQWGVDRYPGGKTVWVQAPR